VFPRDALQVLGERQLTRLVPSAAFEEGERRARAVPGDAGLFAGERQRLLDKLPKTALEVAHGEQLHAKGHQGVWLAGCRAGLGRLDRPPLRRLDVTLHEAPSRLIGQRSPAETGIGHRGSQGASFRHPGLDLRAVPGFHASDKAPGSREQAQPRIVQALGEVAQLVDQPWRCSSVSGAVIAR